MIQAEKYRGISCDAQIIPRYFNTIEQNTAQEAGHFSAALNFLSNVTGAHAAQSGVTRFLTRRSGTGHPAKLARCFRPRDRAAPFTEGERERELGGARLGGFPVGRAAQRRDRPRGRAVKTCRVANFARFDFVVHTCIGVLVFLLCTVSAAYITDC